MEAVRRLDYQPNLIARSLRTRQTFTIGVIVPEFSERLKAAGIPLGLNLLDHSVEV